MARVVAKAAGAGGKECEAWNRALALRRQHDAERVIRKFDCCVVHEGGIHELRAFIIGEGARVNECRGVDETGAEADATQFKLIEEFGKLQTTVARAIGGGADVGI